MSHEHSNSMCSWTFNSDNQLHDCDYEWELQSCTAQPENIDKDITPDQSGSTQARGLITERDAGKRSRPLRFELLWRRTCCGMSAGSSSVRKQTQETKQSLKNWIDETVGCLVLHHSWCQTGGAYWHRAAGYWFSWYVKQSNPLFMNVLWMTLCLLLNN